ncbi:MAG: hypothetical protein F6J98_02290 [Moorea sp. SIO4G2]|nr:hypothetical protein [Moorena sp. SIO4G2]
MNPEVDTQNYSKSSLHLPSSLRELRIAACQAKSTQVRERTLSEIIADLSKPIPLGLISLKPITKKINNEVVVLKRVPYIKVYILSAIFDYICPGWEKKDQADYMGSEVCVKTTLIIHASDGSFSRDAFGTEPVSSKAYGGPLLSASAQSFRRAASLFGLGKYFYHDGTAQATVKKIFAQSQTNEKNDNEQERDYVDNLSLSNYHD